MTQTPLFLLMVFAAIFLLFYALAVPTLGGDKAVRKNISRRLKQVHSASGDDRIQVSLVRRNFLQELSPIEQKLEAIPIIRRLALLIEQGGEHKVAYRVALLYMTIATITALITWFFLHSILFSLGAGIAAFTVLILLLVKKRSDRMDKFDEQLPDALNAITRALRAGYPFTDTLKVVSEEMPDPIAGEFGETFIEISYGYDTKVALYNLIGRTPSVSLMAVVTAVLIQRDTGGNLAEVLEQIGDLIRGRFKLQRQIKTLSAEGRLSGWILGLLPFVLAVMIHFVDPDYLPLMFEHPMGIKLIFGAFVFFFIGVMWIRRIIRFDT